LDRTRLTVSWARRIGLPLRQVHDATQFSLRELRETGPSPHGESQCLSSLNIIKTEEPQEDHGLRLFVNLVDDSPITDPRYPAASNHSACMVTMVLRTLADILTIRRSTLSTKTALPR